MPLLPLPAPRPPMASRYEVAASSLGAGENNTALPSSGSDVMEANAYSSSAAVAVSSCTFKVVFSRNGNPVSQVRARASIIVSRGLYRCTLSTWHFLSAQQLAPTAHGYCRPNHQPGTSRRHCCGPASATPTRSSWRTPGSVPPLLAPRHMPQGEVPPQQPGSGSGASAAAVVWSRRHQLLHRAR